MVVYLGMILFAQEAVIPIRATPRESSEMVSQLIFGDFCELIKSEGSWHNIRHLADGYEGWADAKMLLETNDSLYEQIYTFKYVVKGEAILSNGTRMSLPLGSKIPIFKGKEEEIDFQIGNHEWKFENESQLREISSVPKCEAIQLFMNTPYLWGGRSGNGIDCSGLTQLVFAMCGISIPRDSSVQGEKGQLIPFEEHQPGDLAFFCKANQSRITHVGMVCDSESIIHASGKVREDRFTKKGIIHTTSNDLTHKLISIKRW